MWKDSKKNKLDKTCFAHDTACFDSKDLAKTTISDKILKDRACEIALNPKSGWYQRRLSSMVYRLFDKKLRLEASVNEYLAQELHKPVVGDLKEGKSMLCLKIIFG